MRKKQRRLYFLILLLSCLGIAAGMALYALRENISYFFTPKEVYEYRAYNDARVRDGAVFRLGGLVKKGSLEKDGKTASVSFVVTDTAREIKVQYAGILPDLFREGQGVVATGSMTGEGAFSATGLLARHDEKYTPPELQKKMKETHERGAKDSEDKGEGGAP